MAYLVIMNFAEDEVPANKANLYSIAYRLQTARRSETKIERIKLIIDMLARGEKFH